MSKAKNTLSIDAYHRLLAQQAEQLQKKGRKPRHEESLLQRQCVAWFRATYPDLALMLFAVPNGGGRSKVEAGIMKAEGVTAGVADLILLMQSKPYGALCIELKTTSKTSRQRPSQKAWQAAAKKAGNQYVVCRSLKHFKILVTMYIATGLETWYDAETVKPPVGQKCVVKTQHVNFGAYWNGECWVEHDRKIDRVDFWAKLPEV